MNTLRNLITDLQITLADLARKIDRGEVSSDIVAYPEGRGQVWVGNGFSVSYDPRTRKSAEDAKYPGVGGSKHLPGTTTPPEDSVAGLQLIAHIPSC